jgi:hypothetical protein
MSEFEAGSNPRTREEHLEWCKQRARQYVKYGHLEAAVTSMLSDLRKHPETEDIGIAMGIMGLFEAANGDRARVAAFIEGFH